MGVLDIDHLVHEVAHLLPSQGPLKDFIHHNTLHAYQHLTFFDAVKRSSIQSKAQCLANSEFYESMLQGFPNSRKLKEYALRDGAHNSNKPTYYRKIGLRRFWQEQSSFEIDRLVQGLLIRIGSSYLDQGIAIWPFPIQSQSLWNAVRELVFNSLFPLIPLNHSTCKRLIALNPDEAIVELLTLLVKDQSDSNDYLLELAYLLPGWSGLIYQAESFPEQWVDQRHVTLKEWLALAALIELGSLYKLFGNDWNPAQRSKESVSEVHYDPQIVNLHKATEWGFYRDILQGIQNNIQNRVQNANPQWQLIFCIDDRNFSLRRHIEAESAEIETFGAPGFFGIDCLVEMRGSKQRVKHCPAPVKPGFVIREVVENSRRNWLFHAKSGTHSFTRGLLLIHLLGIPAGLRLLFGVISPRLVVKRRLNAASRPSRLEVFRRNQEGKKDGLFYGYTKEEAALRVGGILRMIGLTKDFAPHIGVIAHGASSVNNPYFAAYDCGACSGRPGAINARVFCKMANDDEVRKLLQDSGITIPKDSKFVPMIHDTTADIIDVLDPNFQNQGIRATLDRALEKNAKERSSLFAFPKNASLRQAKKHAHYRSVCWFEPRPEYNHAKNMACIVGRRHLSKNWQYSNGIFLQSYDPISDPSGDLLKGILGAVVPVCGGINLEYFFSRVDPEVYGAGSKLPQNVVGLYGVMTGLASDLRTGLPLQMTEIHPPVRLLIVIEQDVQVIRKVFEGSPMVYEWVKNEWVRIVAVNPNGSEMSLFQAGDFVDLTLKDLL